MKRLLFLVFFTILFLHTVSALEFDNVKRYDDLKKEVTITNTFGLGKDLAKIQLTSNLNEVVGIGYRKVAEFTVYGKSNEFDIVNKIETYDKRFSDWENRKLTRTLDYKIKEEKTYNIPLYGYAEDGFYKNGTTKYAQVINGYKEQTFIEWRDLEKIDIVENNNMTIGIFTDVREGDYVEWIPTFIGVEVREWATWTASLNVDIESFYKLNETSGSVLDSVGNHDGTNTGAATGVAGVINNSYDFESTDSDRVSFGTAPFNYDVRTEEFSISLWFRLESTGSSYTLFAKQDISAPYHGYGISYDASNRFNFEALDSTSSGFTLRNSTLALNAGEWYHLVITNNGTSNGLGIHTYLNGTEFITSRLGGSLSATTVSNNIAYLGSRDLTSYFDGRIDEVGIWNRSLSAAEVTQLYNGGLGITYTDAGGDTAPTVTLGTPANATTYNSNSISQDFTCKAIDDQAVSNITFYLWNASTGIVLYSAVNTDGQNDTFETFTRTLTGGTNYTWNCLAYDNASQSAYAPNNYTVFVYSVPDSTPHINSSPNNPSGYYIISGMNFVFNFTDVYDGEQIDNVSLVINSVVNQTNSSGVNNTNYIFELVLGEGFYTYYGIVYDNASQSASTDVQNFTIDSTSPTVTITSPSSPYTVTTFNESVQINWTINDINLDTCWYAYVNENTSLIKTVDNQNYTSSLSAPLTGWIYVNDKDNQNVSFVGYQGFGENPSFRIYKNSNTTSGDYQSYTATTTSFNVKVPLNITDNGWHYYELRARTNALNSNSIDQFNLTNAYNGYALTNEITSCAANTTTIYYPSDNPDNVTFVLFANDSVGNFNYDSLLLVKSTVSPNIVIHSPVTVYDTLENGTLVDLNVSVTHSAGTLDTCWYTYPLPWNGTNQIVETCNVNTTFAYQQGAQTIYYYANDTLGNLDNENRTWSILVDIGDITYNQSTFETKSEKFQVNATLDASIDTVTGTFYHNGTAYGTVPTVSGNITTLTSTIDMPIFNSDVNVSLYFELNITTVNGSSFVETSHVNQTIKEIDLSQCSSNFSAQIINYTTRSATTPYPLLNTIFSSTWTYYLSSGSGSTFKNFTYQDLSESASNFSFCFNRPGLPIVVTNEVEVGATGYTSASNFLVNQILVNTSKQAKTIYLLNESLAFATVLGVYDSNQFAISGVTIDIEYFDVGTNSFLLVEQAITSTEGTTVVYLNWLDSQYKFTLSKDNETLQQTLPEILYESPRIFTIADEFDFTYNKFLGIDYDLTYDTTLKTFSLTFLNSDQLYDQACLRVNKKLIQGDLNICDSCSSALSGTLTCDISAQGNGTYIATFYATGSLQSIDWLIEVVGEDFTVTLAEAMGAEDSNFYAFLLGILIVVIMFVSPVMAIIGFIISMYVSYFLGFYVMDYLVLIGITITGVILAWLINR